MVVPIYQILNLSPKNDVKERTLCKQKKKKTEFSLILVSNIQFVLTFGKLARTFQIMVDMNLML